MSSVPLISVVIPTHNRSHLLRSSLASVQAQTLGDIEIIVVDDGSTDNTGDLVREIMTGDPRISYLRQEASGLSAARNLGLSRGRASWIYFLDDDDLADPVGLEALLASATPPAVAGRSWCFSSPSSDVQPDSIRANPDRYRAGPWPPAGLPRSVGLAELLEAPRIPIGAALFSRHAILEAGGFSCQRRAAEDYDLWLRLALLGPIAAVDRVVVYCRHHAGQMSGDQRSQSRQTRLALESFARSHPRAIAGYGRLRLRRRLAGLWREEAYELFRSGRPREGTATALRGLACWPGEWRLWAYVAVGLLRCYPKNLRPGKTDSGRGDSP